MKVAIILPPGYYTSSPPFPCAHLSSLVPENFEKKVFDFSNNSQSALENIIKFSFPRYYSRVFSLNFLAKRVLLGEKPVLKIAEIFSKNHHPEKFMKKLLDYAPDILLVTVPNQSAFSLSLDIIEKYKQENPESVVVYGGYFPSIFTNYIIENFSFIDYVFVGEAYPELPDILNILKKGKKIEGEPGVFFNKEGKSTGRVKTRREFDLDKLPIPDFSWVNWKDYTYKSIPVALSYGCVNSCLFCAERNLLYKFRALSQKRVKEVLNKLVNENGITKFDFHDSLINPSEERVLKLGETISSLESDISWSAFVSLKTTSGKMAKSMSKSGCKSITVGVESSVDRVLEFVNKPHRNSDFVLLSHFQNKGIKINTSWILGFPTQTKYEIIDDINASWRLLKEELIHSCAFSYGISINQYNVDAFTENIELESVNPGYIQKTDMYSRIANYFKYPIQFDSEIKVYKRDFDETTKNIFKISDTIEKYSSVSSSLKRSPTPFRHIQKLILKYLKLEMKENLDKIPKHYRDRISVSI